jgi:hypothetical protein
VSKNTRGLLRGILKCVLQQAQLVSAGAESLRGTTYYTMLQFILAILLSSALVAAQADAAAGTPRLTCYNVV